jgi:hypothetical protein
MLTLKRFAVLATGYGGDLRRWPDDTRAEARALTEASPQARNILAVAQKLDTALQGARTHEDRLLMPPGGQEAALTRLRAGVAARIAAAEAGTVSGAAANQQSRWMSQMALRFAAAPRLDWAAGLATVGGLAILAGLWLGGIAATASATDTVLTLLQVPPSIEILVD